MTKPFRPSLETLGDRIVPTVSLILGDLYVGGTAGNDAVTVTRYDGPVMSEGRTVANPQPAYVVNDNGVVRSFPVSQVTGGVVFEGRGGDDRFDNQTTLRSLAYGGDGNDTLLGGYNNDGLQGGNGNDTLVGRSGDDILYGQGGDDTLDGGLGRDFLYGDAGNDRLQFSADGTWAYPTTSAGGVPLGGAARSLDVFHGGDGSDQVVLTESRDALLLHDGTLPGQDPRRLTALESVAGLGGADLIDLSGPAHALDATLAGIHVDAGAGNDTLVGSARFRSTLSGNVGADTAWVAAGMSQVIGCETVRVTNVPTDAPQTDNWSCGPNSVSRYLRAYGINASYSQVRAFAQQNGVVSDYGLGTTPGNLLQTMRNWKPDAQRVEDTDTARMISLLLQGKPVVALVSMERTPIEVLGVTVGHYGKLHYVVMTGYDAATDTFAYTDTNGAQKAWTRSQFEDKWDWHGHFTGTAGQVAQAGLWTLGLRNRTLFY